VGTAGAGGACTNSLMQVMYGKKNAMALPSHDRSMPSFDGSWADLLLKLRSTLASATNNEGATVFTQVWYST